MSCPRQVVGLDFDSLLACFANHIAEVGRQLQVRLPRGLVRSCGPLRVEFRSHWIDGWMDGDRCHWTLRMEGLIGGKSGCHR